MCPTSAKHGSRLFSIAYLVVVLCEGIPSPQDCLLLRLVDIDELCQPSTSPKSSWTVVKEQCPF